MSHFTQAQLPGLQNRAAPADAKVEQYEPSRAFPGRDGLLGAGRNHILTSDNSPTNGLHGHIFRCSFG